MGRHGPRSSRYSRARPPPPPATAAAAPTAAATATAARHRPSLPLPLEQPPTLGNEDRCLRSSSRPPTLQTSRLPLLSEDSAAADCGCRWSAPPPSPEDDVAAGARCLETLPLPELLPADPLKTPLPLLDQQGSTAACLHQHSCCHAAAQPLSAAAVQICNREGCPEPMQIAAASSHRI